jgi:hypothetical protein
MSFQKRFHIILLLLTAALLLIGGTGCWKEEYSYEGGRDTTIVTVPDTATADSTLMPAPCASCTPAPPGLKQWSFRYDTLLFCGEVTNSVMNPERTAFTFFGPSACTPGTGLIITAYFNAVPFDTDTGSRTATRASLQYYDNNRSRDLFVTNAFSQFRLTIDTFQQQTGTAIGRFSGTVLTSTGEAAIIQSGAFHIQFQ